MIDIHVSENTKITDSVKTTTFPRREPQLSRTESSVVALACNLSSTQQQPVTLAHFALMGLVGGWIALQRT